MSIFIFIHSVQGLSVCSVRSPEGERPAVHEPEAAADLRHGGGGGRGRGRDLQLLRPLRQHGADLALLNLADGLMFSKSGKDSKYTLTVAIQYTILYTFLLIYTYMYDIINRTLYQCT